MKGILTTSLIIVQEVSGLGRSTESVSSSAKISEAITKSYQNGFARRIDLETIRDTVLHPPGQKVALLTTSDDIMFSWEPQKVDVSDNAEQLEVLKHHYSNEFGREVSFDELSKDYSDDSTIYEVIDDKPKSYHGQSGARKAVQDMLAMLPSRSAQGNDHEEEHASKFDLQHVKVNHDHAQVIWKAETPNHTTIFGTDSFTFDKNNRIKTQTTMALTQEAPTSEQKK